MLQKDRDSSFELLRIVAMLMVLCSHYGAHGGFRALHLDLGFNRLFLQAMGLGNVGTCIFVMLAGYFGIRSVFRWRKAGKLELQVLFWSLGIHLAAVASGLVAFVPRDLLSSALPTLTRQYWFFTAYLVLYCLSPFLNRLLTGLSREEFTRLLLVMLALWSICPTFTSFDMYGGEIPQFVMFYSIGAFLRLFPDNPVSRHGVLVVALGSALLAASVVVLNLAGGVSPVFSSHAHFFLNRNSILVVMLSAGLVSLFRGFSIRSRAVNAISANVFGVFLIHAHPLLKYRVWKDLLGAPGFAGSPFLALHMLLSVAFVFCSCCLLEHARIRLFGSGLLQRTARLLFPSPRKDP